MDEHNEVWRDIKGFEGFYQVSDLGRVKSLDRVVKDTKGRTYVKKSRTMVPDVLKNGRYQIGLVDYNNTRIYRKVHQLVAEAFPEICGIKQEGLVVMHLDGDCTNNLATNLRYGTQSENMRHPQSVRLKSEKLRCNKKLSKIVGQFTKDFMLIKAWGSVNEIRRVMNINHGSISNVCNGRCKTYKGFVWRYLDEDGNPIEP